MWKAIVILAVVATMMVAAPAGAEDPIWDVNVDNDAPFIGDPVTFYIDSVYRGEYVILLVEVYNTTEQRINVDIIRIDEFGLANWTWHTRLEDEPGNYAVVFSFKGQPVAHFTINLVYDELDWLTKYTFELEQRIRNQNGRIMETAMIATEARESVWDYIVAPGLVAVFTALINIALIFLVGTRYYMDTVLSKLRTSGKASWFQHAFCPQTDGNFNRMPGYEDVNEPDLELSDEEFIRRSREYTTRRVRIARGS
jgi:hypothetical protein